MITRNKIQRKARVLIVDDSAVMREVLRHILSCDPDIEVLGTASDPIIAREMIKKLNPNVMTLDIVMPKMDGLEFLGHVMRLRPLAVVMISTHTHPGAELAIRALEMGAVDVIGKPTDTSSGSIMSMEQEIRAIVRAAALACVDATGTGTAASSYAPQRPPRDRTEIPYLVALGASTGGVQALNVILSQMPKDSPPILVAQHMPAGFTRSFAERLNRHCPVTVKEAVDGALIEDGNAYLAPGGQHMLVTKSRGQLRVLLRPGAPTDTHAPSIDMLFESVADVAGANAKGVLLTGMGRDGAAGLDKMRRAGAVTACQDETSSLIYGMPKAALALGAVQHELPLERIASFILNAPAGSPGRAREYVKFSA